ncbi:unnamed protein product [Rotaria sordida]|uniref:Delta-like protein n=1 Tax=Rotaria sordida TaxID=392033 RepID=A0A818M0T4_9BILA|nr:unnamed protein product [Rotaria sordida]
MYNIYLSTINILFILLLFNNRQIDCQQSPSVLLVDVTQFDIINNIAIAGQCCDGSIPSGNCSSILSCNLYTIVCLDFVYSGLQTNWTFCPLGSKSFRVTINNTNSLNFHLISNAAIFLPLQFPLALISDNTISIKIFIFYDYMSTGNFTLINQNALLSRFNTTFRIDSSYPSASSGTFQRQTLLDVSRNTPYMNTLSVGLMTYCQATYYGQQCSVRCISNYDCTSSYTCDTITGTKICSPGWYGTECTFRNQSYIQPICSSTALTCNNGGFCQVFNNTNQSTCCCPLGFTGLNCQYLSTCIFNVTCLNGGLCNPAYDPLSRSYYYICSCPTGYTGLYCQERQQCPPTFYGANCTIQCHAPNSCSEGHFSCNTEGGKICLPGWSPISTCLIKNLPSYLDPECSVSTGCLNGGSCFNGSCCCLSTYTGRLCETPINPCAINPCQHNGLCSPTSTGYQCQCSSYYTGQLCEITLNPCDYSPCRNGGQCHLTGNITFYCTCLTGYTGQFCDIQVNYCSSQPCLNNGVCINTMTGFSCVCSPIYTGPTCSIVINPCLSQPCITNNTLNCINNNNLTYTCYCRTGFTGSMCEQTMNSCSLIPSPCKNGGTCINTINGYSCQCNGLYQGSDCSIPIDPCSSNPCIASNSISCQITTTNGTNYSYSCTCQPGYTGSRCETVLNPCDSRPCSFGTCVVSSLTWTCICQPGWTGIQCKDSINECLSNPCLNAGVCIDGINEYRCICLTGYTGTNCQLSMNSCSSNPCQNNGTCVNNIVSISCLCPPGWTGIFCETDINECTSTLICHPNATCINTIGSYRCVCPIWLTGLNCYTTIDLCASFPCQNNGVCIYNYGGILTCRCQSGFTGVYCEINIDDCQPTSCYNNGTCIDQINSFLCLCPSGYTGLRCETIISQCMSLPCLNGGTCRDSYGNTSTTYICICPPLYTGIRCEQILNPCANYPCIHGTCIVNSTIIPPYICQCTSGYTGQNCDIPIDHCLSSPCGLYGTCTNLISSYSCCCAPGYTGLQCTQLINYCLTNPCSNEGVQQCTSITATSFTCLCKSGYTGRYCEININECLSQPCLNGGICVDLVNGYQCLCPSIYGETNCGRLQEQCTGIECLNNGRCIQNGTKFICSCTSGYHGDNCELIINYCQSQPCQNGGICLNTELGPQCTCPNGITGLFCETIIDQCQSETCQNNGTCQSLINRYICLCPNGFMGERCEIERNECEPVNPCLNSGRCIDQLNSFSCICIPGFTGFYCEIQIDQCQSNQCLNGGICRTLINNYKCDCPQGYSGTTCSSLINYCLSNPCLHNGLCVPLLNGYRCICLDDYIGLNCENQSNECLSNPCLNNGTCVDQIWNYTCQCLPEYTGSNCHMLMDYCLSSPCVNGICQNKLNGYDCICSSSYTGIHCEIQINKCTSNPCVSNATCIDGIDHFICLCPPWYSGLTCSEQINPCLNSKACANNGSCLVNYNIEPYGYTCQCLPGFTGDMCEINIDDCITQPCRRGQCIDKVNGFICTCYAGSDGVLCANDVNTCASTPCLNNGVCISLINAYQCQCPFGFQGTNCEQTISQPCSSSPCLNNGTCTIVSSAGFQCACSYGYTGPRCELTINACASNPCRFGTCQQILPGFYYCLCLPGYTDFNCQTDINECRSTPCLNNGICIDMINAFNCTCPNGYSGIQCQYGGYQCNSGPCLNNGTCVITSTGYQCQCLAGLTGNRCEIDINECTSSPCQNAGICLQPSLNSYQCLCPTGYSGTNCEIMLNPCLSIICLNNGTCIRTSSTTGICSCLAGYNGVLCQNQINNCLSAPCLNGTCITLVNSYQCYCFPGYTGQRCDSTINYCSSNPCLNNGTCINQINTYACQCSYGFQGTTCAIRIQACQSSPCLNGGICYDIGPGLLNCSCPASYHGSFCQLRDSFCTQMPCQNNGSCIETLNGYQCICREGYDGINCTNIIQPCLSKPCLNNGICSNLNNSLGYQCFCPIGYGGLRCELNINWCSSNPCQNQGTCVSQTTSFICLCPPMYTGVVCQTLINNCSSLNCGIGIPVITNPNNCTCICSSGYTGNLCQTTIGNLSYCIRGTCNYLGPGLANCTCPINYSGLRCDTRLSEGVCASCPCLYGQCRIIDQTNSYICDCYQGYTGQRCETSINLCLTTPCVYGQCILDAIYGYRCICLPGATGQNCSILINTCASRPCQNNGLCVQGLNTYQCICLPGYAGINCEILINQCTSLICLNNGTCINLPSTPSAICQCLPLFTGLQCQYPYAPCTSQPCQNLGSCISLNSSSYICLCPSGFTGTNCEISLHVCSSRPCLNGGTCIEPTSNYYICQCPWPFYGVNCQLACDPCSSYPCRGPLSQCISSPIYYNYTCVCAPGFNGTTCSIPYDPCISNPCRNMGTCIRTGPLTYSCACLAGYNGSYCEIQINPCSYYSCGNGTSMITSPINCQCQCPYPYYGTLCQINVCQANPCLIGNCIANGNYSYICNCPVGFQYIMGVCVDINECTTIPGICANNGRCLNSYGSYLCFCNSGFYGTNCEIYEPCRSLPCINNGTCVSTGNYPYWTCICPILYTGSRCEIIFLGCSSNPCRTGTCISLPNGSYQCLCPSLMTGINCDIPLLPCSSNPCLNNATCFTLSLTNYTCICPPLYTGLQCSIQILICSSNPCQGNSTCIVNPLTGVQTCQCPPERYGVYCEILSPCGSNPCIRGTCQNRNSTSFQCACEPGFTGNACEIPFDVCTSNPCMNGGTCRNLGDGFYTCTCPVGFTGSNCEIPLCVTGNCFNGGTCLIQNNTLRCQCPCGFTGSRCETPLDICSLTLCQNNGTRIVNITGCQCTCLCSSTFTGNLCQLPIIPVNRTYPGQIIIPIDRPGGSSWEIISQCIDQVWNSLNVLLACNSPFTIVNPTSFYPYCYQMNQQSSLVTQLNAIQDCSDKSAQLVWFQSIDEIQQQLIPALFVRGLTRDFWTSGIFNSILNRWQWLLSNNNTRIDIDSSILTQFGINPLGGQSLHYSFAELSNRRLISSSSSETYSTLCKISATRFLLNNQTRSIDLTSQQYGFQNQTQVIFYKFNYTIFSTIPTNTLIQQPTAAQYSTMCGAMGSPSTPVDPYIIDICGYFPSINDGNVQLLMQTISSYYTSHRITILSTQIYTAIPLNVEHYVTISGDLMTRIRFIITSPSSIILGSNIEPLASINDILNTINYRIYQQCIPYISLNILLPLKLCIPFNEISLWTNLIANAVSAATGQLSVTVMLKGVRQGVTSTGQPANIAYFLITINGMTYNQTIDSNLASNPILISTITQTNNQLLCSNQTQIVPIQYSIQNFYVPCPIPQILQRQLNNALQRAGIYTINMTIFGVEEAVDNLGQIYRLPNIYIQHQNGTWLDSPLQLNNQLYQILISVQMQQLTIRVYILSKAYSYFYLNSLTTNDRDFLQRLILTLYNQQSSITSNNVKILLEDPYLNISSLITIQRVYAFLFYNDQELDGRYLSSLVLSPSQFMSPFYIQTPLTYVSNLIPTNVVKQRDIQKITFTGKIGQTLAQTALTDYWQNPIRQGLTNTNVYIIQLQQYLIYSINQYYTTINYIVMTSDGYTIPSACFNPSLLQPLNGLCDAPNNYVAQVPFSYTPSFIDLRGNYLKADLDQDNFQTLITSALQRTGISSTVSSILIEPRFGFDMSLVTRVYYMVVPNQIITQEQIQAQLNSIFSTMQPIKYDLYSSGQLSIARSDAHQYIGNVSLPLTTLIRQDIENYLTSFNRQYGIAKIVYAESLNANQTRFYLAFLNGTQVLTRCDFFLYYPGVTNIANGTGGFYSIYLERNVFVGQPNALANGLAQIWTNQNLGVPAGVLFVQLQNQIQYICSGGRKSVRVDYIVQSLSTNVVVNNLTPPPNSAFEQLYGQYVNTSRCISYQAHWLYLIEPRPSNDLIRSALENAWRQSNNNLQINISPEFYFDSSYLTINNQTLIRLTYTINLNGSDLSSLMVTQPLLNSILLSNIYTGIPYKKFSIYVDGNKINLTSPTTLSMINQALRTSWSLANSNLFSANDVSIPSINSALLNNGQTKIDYMIGLNSGDIGDYSQPSERSYTQIFNQTGLQTLVYTRYIPGYNNLMITNNNQTSNLPFYYRFGPIDGLAWWIILIIVIGILTIWLIICLICYICCRRRAERNSSSVVIHDVQHVSNNEPIYGTHPILYPLSKRKHSVSVIDLQDQPSTREFRRPKRTTRSVSPSNSFRYILPFNSQREQKTKNFEQTSLGNTQNVPITITKSPMYNNDYL